VLIQRTVFKILRPVNFSGCAVFKTL